MLLHVGIRILSCKISIGDPSKVDYAEALLTTFVKQSHSIYGNKFVTYNVHNLIHLADECRQCGPLDTFSCFPFENHLGTLKNLVRRSNNPLEQLVNRIIEIRANQPEFPDKEFQFKNESQLSVNHFDGPVIRNLTGNQYKKLIFKKFRLTCKAPDNCVVTKENHVVVIENFLEMNDSKITIIGRKFMNSKNFYNLNGLQSLPLGIQVCDSTGALESWPLESIVFKAMKLPLKDDGLPGLPPPNKGFVIINLMNYDLEDQGNFIDLMKYKF